MNGEKPAADRSATCHNIPHPTSTIDVATIHLDAGEGPDPLRCRLSADCRRPEDCRLNLPCWGGEGRVGVPRVVAVRVGRRMYVRYVVDGIPYRVEIIHRPRSLAGVLRLALGYADLPGVS